MEGSRVRGKAGSTVPRESGPTFLGTLVSLCELQGLCLDVRLVFRDVLKVTVTTLFVYLSLPGLF